MITQIKAVAPGAALVRGPSRMTAWHLEPQRGGSLRLLSWQQSACRRRWLRRVARCVHPASADSHGASRSARPCSGHFTASGSFDPALHGLPSPRVGSCCDAPMVPAGDRLRQPVATLTAHRVLVPPCTGSCHPAPGHALALRQLPRALPCGNPWLVSRRIGFYGPALYRVVPLHTRSGRDPAMVGADGDPQQPAVLLTARGVLVRPAR